ncbi:MAG: NAD(+)/NADH kinase [Anaerolineae bacterium]
MVTVGIIANPQSGKDIRRVVAHASTFDNHEKVNIVRRLLASLDALGVGDVLIMPDSFGIGGRAVEKTRLSLAVRTLDMAPTFAQGDSTRAARLMAEAGVACIITLGGDGTNRAVAKGSGRVPLLPISTGTNNVFPRMVDATLAGLAAGFVAAGRVAGDDVIRPTRRLDVLRAGEMLDMALVDIAVYADRFIGARAVWDMSRVRGIAVTHVAPNVIGLSSAPGALPEALAAGPDYGAWVALGKGGTTVLAAVAPGDVRPIGIATFRPLAVGDEVSVDTAPAVLALDGEREVSVRPGETLTLRLSADGPPVIDVEAALRAAAQSGAFVQKR